MRLYVEELPRTSTMIEQWLLYTNWGRTQMRGLPILLPLMLLCVITACVKVNPLRATQVWTFRLLDSNCILRSSEMWFKVVIFIKPYKHFISSHLSFWGGGGGSMRDYFRSRSTMQLPSTEYNFLPSTVDNIRQHLLHHSTSFIAFSKANNNPRSLLHNNRINKEYEEEKAYPKYGPQENYLPFIWVNW